jgi:transposase
VKDITKLVAQSQLMRRAVEQWRKDLPTANDALINATNEVRHAVADGLDKKASEWFAENKLIHAGYAQKLSDELRKKL